MSKINKIFKKIWLPMSMILGVSLHRLFFLKDENWLIPFIVTVLYTIWYLFTVIKEHKNGSI